MTDFEKLKSDMEEWMRRLGIEPPVGIHDYVPLIMNRVELDNRLLLGQAKDAEAKITGLKEALFRNVNGYIEVEAASYATGTHLFDYVFTNCEPQINDVINDVIKEGRSEYRVVGREWINGRLCLLVVLERRNVKGASE